MSRYEVTYNPQIEGVEKSLRELGAVIPFKSQSAGKMIAEIPEGIIDSVRGLTGIVSLTESPLPE